jgi:TATA-binding protein-associated factor
MNDLVSPFFLVETGRQRQAKLVSQSLLHSCMRLRWYFHPAALALEALHKQVLPFLLRRLKEDVLHDLPPKIIQDYYCELSETQKLLYDDFAKSEAKAEVEGVIQSSTSGQSGKEGGQKHVFQSLQYLRKLCNHPSLVLKTNNDAVMAALAKVGSNAENLSDIQHAPKLQALR